MTCSALVGFCVPRMPPPIPAPMPPAPPEPHLPPAPPPPPMSPMSSPPPPPRCADARPAASTAANKNRTTMKPPLPLGFLNYGMASAARVVLHHYSQRRASCGSILDALRAGIQHATSAEPSNKTDT